MTTPYYEREITLSVRELQHMRSWYRAFSADRDVALTPFDLVLDAKLAYHQADMLARAAVGRDAQRERATNVRLRHTGVERRNREVQVIAAPTHRRIVRYALRTI